MKNLILKSIFFFAFLSFTTLSAQQFNIVYNNSSGCVITLRVYDASNNLLTTQNIPTGNGFFILCFNGVPALLHFIDNGGCLVSNSVNTTANTCSTCTVCTCFTTTSPSFSNTLVANTLCAPIANELTVNF